MALVWRPAKGLSAGDAGRSWARLAAEARFDPVEPEFDVAGVREGKGVQQIECDGPLEARDVKGR
jgi:hypothetical protein